MEVGDFHFGGPASDVYAPSPSGFTPSDSPVWRGRATSSHEGEVITLASGGMVAVVVSSPSKIRGGVGGVDNHWGLMVAALKILQNL